MNEVKFKDFLMKTVNVPLVCKNECGRFLLDYSKIGLDKSIKCPVCGEELKENSNFQNNRKYIPMSSVIFASDTDFIVVDKEENLYSFDEFEFNIEQKYNVVIENPEMVPLFKNFYFNKNLVKDLNFNLKICWDYPDGVNATPSLSFTIENTNIFHGRTFPLRIKLDKNTIQEFKNAIKYGFYFYPRLDNEYLPIKYKKIFEEYVDILKSELSEEEFDRIQLFNELNFEDVFRERTWRDMNEELDTYDISVTAVSINNISLEEKNER